MPPALHPGVYVEEIPFGVRPIEGVGTSTTGFVGEKPGRGTVRLSGYAGHASAFAPGSPLGDAVRLFFAAGGRDAWVADGLEGLDGADELGLLCLPGESDVEVLRAALAYADRRRAFLLVDPPGVDAERAIALARTLAETGNANAAVYYPPIEIEVYGTARTVPPSGSVAGTYARTDAAGGVWSPPAGDDAVLPGVAGLAVAVDRPLSEALADAGVNAIRSFPRRGIRVWGGRTIAQPSSEWKYVSVRRTALFVERSLDRGLEWAVFEPNDEPLWAEVRAQVGVFLHELFRAGAFPASSAREAYFVKCGRDTMTQNDIDSGHLIVMIGIAPVKPAEFVVLRIGKRLAGVGRDSVESTGEPNQRLRLRHRPIGAEGVFVQVEDETGWTTWSPVERFDAAGTSDRVYVLDRERGEVIFGDGERAAVPPRGASVQATYRHDAPRSR